MSIATEITKLQNNLSNAYIAIENKGGTIPTQKTMANLSSAIDSVVTAPKYDMLAYLGRYIEEFKDDGQISSLHKAAFCDNVTLKTIELPAITKIPENCFIRDTGLSSITTGRLTEVGQYAFYNCRLLTGNIDFSNISVINNYTFYSNSALSSIGSLSNIIEVKDHACAVMSKIPNFDLPNVLSIGNSAFFRCSGASYINIPKIKHISSKAFYQMSKTKLLSVIIDQVTEVPYLENSDAFPTETATSKAAYKIYVSQALYNDFCNATNWSALSSHIIGI